MFGDPHAFELPVSMSSPLAVAVGALAGACAFLAVLAVFMSGWRKEVSKEGTRPALLPPPPSWAARAPSWAPMHASFDPTVIPMSPRGYAKMGFAFGERVEDDPIDPLEALAPMREAPADTEIFPKVKVAPIVVLSGPSGETNRDPAPLAVIRGGVSPAVSPPSTSRYASSIEDLSFEDLPTAIGEPDFDEVAPPRTRGSRPRIRAIAPTPPRFPAVVS
jgi:hypothetical protein